ncbi:MAG: hypothetical protein ACHQQP_08180 [Gemmatimonadales bacterium]|jgi:hypothetical protein
MDILLSALDPRAGATSEPDDPGFADLIARVTQRLDALGAQVCATELNAVVLEVVQDVARFTLSWAEPEDHVVPAHVESRGVAMQSNEAMRGERRW